MEKNVIVTDAKGIVIGATYPKRAAGLVKHGRAEYAGDCTIRLLHTHAPSVVTNDNTEDFFMSKIINFNARDFRFGSQNKYGGRMFVTKGGSNREVFELGTTDDGMRWGGGPNRNRFGTWIYAKNDLEPHTDYVFRIEVGCDGTLDDESELRVAIFDVQDYEDKTLYPLGQSRFAPVISKKTAKGDLIRVFELPYHTGEGTEFQINVFAYNCHVILDAPSDYSEYAALEDCTYLEWSQGTRNSPCPDDAARRAVDGRIYQRALELANVSTVSVPLLQRKLGIGYNEAKALYAELDRRGDLRNTPGYEEHIARSEDGSDVGNDQSASKTGDFSDIGALGALGDLGRQIAAHISEKLSGGIGGKGLGKTISETVRQAAGDMGAGVTIDDLELDESAFAAWLANVGNGSSLDVSDAQVALSPENVNLSFGQSAAGSRISVADSELTSRAFAMLVHKIGDGCNAEFSDCTETTAPESLYFGRGSAFNGCNVTLCGCELSAATAAALFTRVGSGCNVELEDCTVTREGLEFFDLGVTVKREADNFELTDVKLPRELYEYLKGSLGMTSKLDTDGVKLI